MSESRNIYLRSIEDDLEEGDLLKFVRYSGIYSHHAVYIGMLNVNS